MTLTPQAVKQIVVIGITELVLGLLAIIIGVVAMSKTSNVTFSIWTIYFVIPGILCIIASRYNNHYTMGLALAANILGTILSVVVLYLEYEYIQHLVWDEYWCNIDYSYYHKADTICSHLKNVKIDVTLVTITHGLLVVVSFMGSILGCQTMQHVVLEE